MTREILVRRVVLVVIGVTLVLAVIMIWAHMSGPSGVDQNAARPAPVSSDPFLPETPAPRSQPEAIAPPVQRGAVTLVPARISMSGQLNQPRAAQIVITNTGGGPVVIERVTRAGDQAFSVSSSCGRIEERGECVVDVVFAPAFAGLYQATVLVHQEGGQIARAEMQATAEAPVAVAPAPAAVYQQAGPSQHEVTLEQYRRHRLARSSVQIPGLAVEAEEPSGVYGADWQQDTSSLPVDLSRILTTDSYIPAVLETSINSQLGGRVTAMVERDVFGRHGSYILIPKGAKLQGYYDPPGSRGDSRLAVIWSRIIRPDGVHIVLKAPSADQMGRSGLVGVVDRRYEERFGLATLVSLIDIAATAGAAAAAGNTTVTTVGNSSIYTQDAMSEALRSSGERTSQRLGGIAEQLIQESRDILPRITIAQGTRFSVTPIKDLVLREVPRQRIDARAFIEAVPLETAQQTAQQPPSGQVLVYPPYPLDRAAAGSYPHVTPPTDPGQIGTGFPGQVAVSGGSAAAGQGAVQGNQPGSGPLVRTGPADAPSATSASGSSGAIAARGSQAQPPAAQPSADSPYRFAPATTTPMAPAGLGPSR